MAKNKGRDIKYSRRFHKVIRAILFGLLVPLSCLSGLVLGAIVQGLAQGQEQGWMSIGPHNATITRLAVETLTSARNARGAGAMLVYAQTPEEVLVFANGQSWSSLPTPPSWDAPEWFLLQGQRGVRAAALTTRGIIEFSYGADPRVSESVGLPAKWRFLSVENCRNRPATLYAAVEEEKTQADDGPDLLFKSTNGGLSWMTVHGWSDCGNTSSLFDVKVNPVNPDDVSLILDIGGASALLKTTNGGVTWRSTALGDAHFDYLDLVYAPSNPGVVYVLAADRGIANLYWSSNSLKSVTLRSRFPSAYALTVDSNDDRHLFVLAHPHRLEESCNGGQTWHTVNTTDLGKSVALSLAVDAGGRVYIGTARNGIFVREPVGTLSRFAHPGSIRATSTTQTNR